MYRDFKKIGRRSRKVGRFFEVIALLILITKGYKILKFRYKTLVGEIDIIAKRKDIVCFVEVKAVFSLEQGDLVVRVPQQKRIVRAAQLFLKHFPFDGCSIRFDVISFRSFFSFVHTKNAFHENIF